jgi:hypothetical protein
MPLEIENARWTDARSIGLENVIWMIGEEVALVAVGP